MDIMPIEDVMIYFGAGFICGIALYWGIAASRVSACLYDAQEKMKEAEKMFDSAKKMQNTYEAVLRSMPGDGKVYRRIT